MTARLVSACTLVLLGALVLAAGASRRGAELTGPQLEWLKTHAIELTTVEAGNGFADLQPLKAAIGDARIVSLGEATHGTREIFQMKHRLVEFLASELDFTMFSIEANMPEAYRVNEYVLHGTGDPKALLQGMYFWTWNTEEVLALIEWMRRFNASGKGRVQFTGFDMQTPQVAIENVQRFLQQVDAPYAQTARTIYQIVGRLQPSQNAFGVATGTFPVHAAAGRRIRFSGAIKTRDLEGFAGLWWRADGPEGVLAFDNMQTRGPRGTSEWRRYDLVLDIPHETVNVNFGVLMAGTGAAWFDDLRVETDGKPYDAAGHFDFDFEGGRIRGFATPAPGYVVRIDDAAASRGTHSLRIESETAPGESREALAADAGRRFAEVVAHLENARDRYRERAPAQPVEWAIQNARVVHQYALMIGGQTSRDESMARNVEWILETAPKGTRVVLWAHNGHVGRIRMGGFRAMGAYLDEWYGPDHVAVGFALDRGEYTAVGNTGLGTHKLHPGPTGSYEAAFSRAGMQRFILDLRTARAEDPASGWLHSPMQFRSVGAVAMEQQFHQVNLGGMFDLIVFLQQTTPTRGLSQRP